MAKLRIGFDIEAATLFGMLAKMLPIDNLNVEELEPPRFNLKDQVEKLGADSLLPAKRKKGRRTGYAPDLTTGINAALLGVLSDGQPHRAADMKAALKAAGFSENSAGSRLGALRAKGIVEQVGDGTWRRAS